MLLNDMLKKMGMRRDLFETGKSLDEDGGGQFGAELCLYIHSAQDIMHNVVGSISM